MAGIKWLVLLDRYADGPLGGTEAMHGNEGEIEWKIVEALDDQQAIEIATRYSRGTLSSPRPDTMGTPTHCATAIQLDDLTIFPFQVRQRTEYDFEWKERDE